MYNNVGQIFQTLNKPKICWEHRRHRIRGVATFKEIFTFSKRSFLHLGSVGTRQLGPSR